MQQLEQSIVHQPYQAPVSQREQMTYFVVGDLEQLSVSALYSLKDIKGFKSDEDLLMEVFEENIHQVLRPCESKPLGSHINAEVWLELKGSKSGRFEKLSNGHISLEEAPSNPPLMNPKFMK